MSYPVETKPWQANCGETTSLRRKLGNCGELGKGLAGQKAGSYEPVAGKTIHKVRGNNGLVETRGDEDLNIDAEDGYRG